MNRLCECYKPTLAGNIRELENVIERLAILTENGVVTAADVISDLKLNGETDHNEPRELILSKELKCLTDGQCKGLQHRSSYYSHGGSNARGCAPIGSHAEQPKKSSGPPK